MKREALSTAAEHERLMRVCFALAAKGRGRVSPNPLVGAVLAKNGRILSRGWHRRFGGPHAEVECLQQFQGNAGKATLYVNLEPCAHFGKTPPCTDLIIAAGVGRVVVGMKDPNPRVSGQGIRKLRQAGIHVTTGILQQEARSLNKFFLKHIATGMPYVHVKIAQTLDGYIGGVGAPRWISGKHSLTLVHQWRTEYDAVLIGAGTVKTDDPLITVRHVRGRHPHVIVLDGNMSLAESAPLLRVQRDRYVFLCVSKEAGENRREKVRRLEERGIIVLQFKGKNGIFPVRDVLREVYRYGVGSVLVEGGSSVFAQLRDERLTDELSVFVSPLTLGGGTPVYATTGTSIIPEMREATTTVRMSGRDVLFTTVYQQGG